jgi:hypothetical protein
VSLRRGSAGAVALLAAVSLLASVLLAAAADMPYLGEWSNGRGETLVITAKTLQFGEERAVPYRDVTRATDGESFELQITARDEVNRLGGKTLAIEFDDDAMKITAYASHADYMQEKDPQSVVTWFKEDE